MHDKRILITGAGGFVGRNLSESLSGKYTIFALTHRELDILDEKSVETFIKSNEINLIIHCANVGGSRKNNYDSKDVISNNLRMFFNLERCLTSGIRMIHFGSGTEFDRRNYTPKMPESLFGKYIPEDDYGYSKYLISKYIEKTDNITCLRLFGLYGKYEDYQYKFISNAIVKNLLKLPITINQNVVFDFMYIDDLVSIVDKIIQEKPRCKIINTTPSESISLVAIAGLINEISDYKDEILILNEGLNREYSGDNTLLQEIGPFEFTPYRDGIRKLYKYYESVLDHLDNDIIKADPYLKFCKMYNS